MATSAGLTPEGAQADTTFAVARYDANGTLDTSFGPDGSGIAPVPDGVTANSLAIQPDGKVVAVGRKGRWNERFFWLIDGKMITTREKVYSGSYPYLARYLGSATMTTSSPSLSASSLRISSSVPSSAGANPVFAPQPLDPPLSRLPAHWRRLRGVTRSS